MFGRGPVTAANESLSGLRQVSLLFLTVLLCLMSGMAATARGDSGKPAREQAVELSRSANDAFAQGDLKNAYENYTAAEKIFKSLAEKNPAVLQAQFDLAVINERLGDLYVRMDNGGKARFAYARNLNILEQLNRNYPEDLDVLQDIIVGNLKIGDLYVWLAKAEKAAAAYEKGVSYCEKLSGMAPKNMDVRRDLCLLWFRQGCLLRKAGLKEKAEAARSYELEARKALLSMNTDKGKEALFLGYKLLGEQYNMVGQWADSIVAYNEALDLLTSLLRTDPVTIPYQWEFSSIYRNIGEAQAQLGQLNDAEAAYKRVLNISEQLVKAVPDNLDFQRDLVVTHYKIGKISEAKGDKKQALYEYQAALSLAENMARNNPENDQLQQDISEIKKMIGAIEG